MRKRYVIKTNTNSSGVLSNNYQMLSKNYDITNANLQDNQVRKILCETLFGFRKKQWNTSISFCFSLVPIQTFIKMTTIGRELMGNLFSEQYD